MNTSIKSIPVVRTWKCILKHYRYVYASSGRTASYVNWFPGEPNLPQREQCAEVRPFGGAQWNNLPCDYTRSFACQKCKLSHQYFLEMFK